MADDRGPQLAGILIAFLVLSIVSTILRCYSMGVILKRFYIEDWLAVISLVSLGALNISPLLLHAH